CVNEHLLKHRHASGRLQNAAPDPHAARFARGHQAWRYRSMISAAVGTRGLFAGLPEASASEAIFSIFVSSASFVTPRHCLSHGNSRSAFNFSSHATKAAQALSSATSGPAQPTVRAIVA